MYSLSGKLIFSSKKINHNGVLDLNLEHLAQGIYILKGVSSGDTLIFQRKIIKYLHKKGFKSFDNILDVGAHKGESINLFLSNFKTKTIYSFEASPMTFKILSDKIDNDNIKSDILHIFPITLSCVITMLVSIYLYI